MSGDLEVNFNMLSNIKEDVIDNNEKISHAEYILKCVVQTFANKLYVQKIFLNK